MCGMLRTDGGVVFAVTSPPGETHGVFADLCRLSLSQLSETRHSGAPQQQVRAAQMHLRACEHKSLTGTVAERLTRVRSRAFREFTCLNM